jgi:hypothetical protein
MPPFTIGEGILGLEAVHRIANHVDLNTQTGLPRVELDRITGLHSLPDADDNREATYAMTGERVFPSLNRGRTITYEGRILAADLHGLRAMAMQLRYAGTVGRLSETSVVVTPHPSVGGVAHRYDARILALEIDDTQTRGYEAMPTPYQRDFVLTVRQSDPRYYLVGQDVTVSATAADVVAVTNPGNFDALPVFTVNGPIPTDLFFQREDNFVERALVYEDVGLASGQQLRLNFNDRTLTRVSDGASYEHKRAFDLSNWWDTTAAGLNPGVTHISVVGGGNWTCTFTPANW